MRAPHVIPYQGSKRKIADEILNNIKFKVKGRLFEPFAGSAAITLSSATQGIADSYIIGDKYEPIVNLWKEIIESPSSVADKYELLWNSQLEDPKKFFLETRDQFNIDSDPVKFLYLVARCVKNAIRFNSNGYFNQSSDNRRLGTKPNKIRKEIEEASHLLNGRVELRVGDFMNILEDVNSDDLVYMDPPWQGTSNKKDSRYAYLLDLYRFIEDIKILNKKKVPFLLSFDGTCGNKSYGDELPKELGLTKFCIDAGKSSQATLLGRSETTTESLYISPALADKNLIEDTKLSQIKMFG